MDNDDTQDTLDPKERLKRHVQHLVLATMKRHDWNQSDLGRQTGLSRNSISLYARGKSIPSYEHAAKLGRVLKVDPAELTGLKDAEERAHEPETVDVTRMASGKYQLSLRKELTAAQLTRILELLEVMNEEDAKRS